MKKIDLFSFTINKKYFHFFSFIVILCLIIYYLLSANTIIDTINNLSSNDTDSITKINITVIEGFYHYKYILTRKDGIEKYINELNNIKIRKSFYRNYSYANLKFENYIISLYDEDMLVAYIEVIRRDVWIGGITNKTSHYRIADYSNVNLKNFYELSSEFGQIVEE